MLLRIFVMPIPNINFDIFPFPSSKENNKGYFLFIRNTINSNNFSAVNGG